MRSVRVVAVCSVFVAAALALFAPPGEAEGPLRYHTLTPCRLADTRGADGPSGGPALVGGQERAFPVQGLQPCGVPVGARAVSVNVTAVGPNGPGFLTLFPNGIERPVVSNLNFSAEEPALGNGAIVPLADHQSHPEADLKVYARVAASGTTGTVNMVLDVTGYFLP